MNLNLMPRENLAEDDPIPRPAGGSQEGAQTQTQPWVSQVLSSPCHEIPWGILYNMRKKTSVVLIEDVFKVGRDSRSDYCLDESTLYKERWKFCSRDHFEIVREKSASGVYVVSIHDKSASGTFVNYNLVGMNKFRPLCDNDKISIAKPEFETFLFFDRQQRKVPGIPEEVTKNYFILDDLGKGGFGKVYLVLKQTTKQRMAMKALKVDFEQNPNLSPFNEVSIMLKLKHPHIVQVFETTMIKEDCFIFMQYMPGGDLFQYIKSRKNNLTELEAKVILYQVSKAAVALHEQNIVHRDIKPANILLLSVKSYPFVKLTDFGLSKILSCGIEPVRTLCGTRAFAAPEVNLLYGTQNRNGCFDSRCDVWSLGVLLYYCLSRRLPFETKEEEPSMGFKMKNRIILFEPPTVWKNISFSAKYLINCMLKYNFQERPYSVEVVGNTYFDDNNFKKIYRQVCSSENKPADEACGDENDPNVKFYLS